MHPTKLPDDLFPGDEWRAADYPRRVALMVAAIKASREAIDMANGAFEIMKGERALLLEELRMVREVNASLVLELERQKLTNGQ